MRLFQACKLDFENRTKYNMTVRVTDGFSAVRYNETNLFLSVTGVNDNTPTFVGGGGAKFKAANATNKSIVARYAAVVSGGLAVGTPFMRLAAEDKDLPASDNTLTYAMENTTSDADKKRFALDTKTGDISLTFIDVFDTDSRNFTLSVRVTDAGGLYASAKIDILHLMEDFNHFMFRNDYYGHEGSFEVFGYGPAHLTPKIMYTKQAGPKIHRIRGHLAANKDHLWYDRRSVQVVMQVLDNAYIVPAAGQVARAVMTPGKLLAEYGNVDPRYHLIHIHIHIYIYIYIYI